MSSVLPTPATTYSPTDPNYLAFLRAEAADRKSISAAALVEQARNATAQTAIATAMANQVEVHRAAMAASTAAFLNVPAAQRMSDEALTINAWLAIAAAGNSLPTAVTLAIAQVAEFRKKFPLARPSASFPAPVPAPSPTPVPAPSPV